MKSKKTDNVTSITPTIYLLGFMGSGKSYTGRKLATYLNRPFHDLDDLIEIAAGTTIKSVFERQGETYFRELEHKTLLTTTELSGAIIACGGGTPCFHDNMEWINANGLSVFIDVPEEILVARLEKEAEHRPVLHGGPTISEIVTTKMAERRVYYEMAHLHLRVERADQDLAALLRDQYANIIGH